ncbi:hypothetical protein BGX20_005673, partial [Mortierella sp. AD010]
MACCVHPSITGNYHIAIITLDCLDDKTELANPMTRFSKLFPENPDDDTYIIFQRHPQ